MRTGEQMNELLSEMAAADTPTPDPAFVERLDARLRVAHAERSAVPGRRVVWIPALALAAVLVVGLAGTLLARSRESDAVVMTVASDTSVYFDDGPVPGTPGLVLENGTRIVVGPAGEAVVDGVILAPGSEAVVVDARVTLVVGGGDQGSTDLDRSTLIVRPQDERAAQPPSPTSTRPAPPPSTTGSTGSGVERSVGAPGSTTIASDTITDRSSPDQDTTSTGAPATTRPTSTRPAPTRPASTTSVPPTRPSTTTTTTGTPAGRISLTATEVGSDRLRLDWVIGRDLTPSGWRVLAGRGDRVTTLLVIRGGDARSATLERAVTDGRSLWVEAVDRSGETMAASEPISIG